MTISNFILTQPPDRQQLLTNIHEIIIDNDKGVEAKIDTMMGKEMIIYNTSGMFKYGLASVKKYMSLHVLPIYASQILYLKYKDLLDKATLQKGCINFKNEEEMPLKIVTQLIIDCAKIDMQSLKEAFKSKAKK